MKQLVLVLAIGVIFATAQRWPGSNGRQNQWNGQGGEENNQFNRPWNRPNNNNNQNRPWNNNNQNRPWNNRPDQNRPWNRPEDNDQTTQRLTSTSSSIGTSSTSSDFTSTASPAFTACMARCQTPNNYNPVCGTDARTYENPQRLACAVRCGHTVSEAFGGTCVPL